MSLTWLACGCFEISSSLRNVNCFVWRSYRSLRINSIALAESLSSILSCLPIIPCLRFSLSASSRILNSSSSNSLSSLQFRARSVVSSLYFLVMVLCSHSKVQMEKEFPKYHDLMSYLLKIQLR